jgi:drug/metabolite transporter (DMT)-like permease
MKRWLDSGSFYIVLAAIVWSFGGLLGKLIVWNGLTIAALRGILAAMTIALYRRSWRVTLSPSIILAALSLTLTTVLFMVANKLTTAANAIVLQYTSPMYIILLSWIFFKQVPKRRDVFALLGVGFGIVLFFVDRFENASLLGNSLGLLSGLSFAGVFFANKLPKASPMDASYLGNVLSVFLLPLLLLDESFMRFDLSSWMLIVLMGVVQLGLGYILFSKGIQKTSATSAGIIAGLEPILNPLWVWLILQEQPSSFALFGALIVLSTVMIYNLLLTKDNYQKT